MNDDTCRAIGCGVVGRTRRGWCGKHYHRWYRHGDPSVLHSEQAARPSLGRRYRYMTVPAGHPLITNPSRRVYVHRAVLFGSIGYGPHCCHWCSQPISWGGRGHGSLNVDHLDGDGANNDPGNLVASCQGCNTARAQTIKA